MYKQLTALFARYAAAHIKVQGKPQSVRSADGQMIGALDVVSLANGQIRVAGWTIADDVVIHMNGIKASTKATLRREDVALAHGIDPHLGFDLVLPLGPVGLREMARFGIKFHLSPDPDKTVAMTLPLVGIRRMQVFILVRFMAAMASQITTCFRWIITRNPRYRARIKQALKLASLPDAQELDPDLFRAWTPPPCPAGMTIVMPVFNAFDLLQEALERVRNNTDVPWRLILIEDCSTDDRIRPFLKDWKAGHPDSVILLENETNLGFIRSVNRGLENAILWPDPVVLLNSDALVPKNWASRLLAPMVIGPNVATVTPMSNEAEIFTVPLICKPQPLGPGQGEAIDAFAMQLNPAAERVTTPTGVGFCMAINMKYLAKLPQLDTDFGRGYGEEVDWCQRARNIGGVHLCAANLFVEHRGGQSFGSTEKQRLIAANNQKITRRYPAYDTEVERFMKADPLRSTRLALALAWIGTQDAYPVSIYLAHSMGGGAEAYLQSRIKTKHHSLGRSAVVLRVGGKKRWQVELVTPNGIISGQTDDLDYVHTLLKPVTRRRLIYSCGVGDRDPSTLPDVLLGLADGGRTAIEILFHDYFPLSPSYTLLNDEGRFVGVPQAAEEAALGYHCFTTQDQTVSLPAWKSEWGKLMEQAKEVVVFSENSAKIVGAAYPQVVSKLAIKPHELLCPVPLLDPPASTARRVVGVLGDIGPQKGAGLMLELAQYLERHNIGLAIIGNFDTRFPIPPSVPVHGTYQSSNIPQLAARYRVTDWFIPSIWPETFSFTTHEALATGLPVHAFALGAQGDAVTQAANGMPIPYSVEEDLNHSLRVHFSSLVSLSKRAA